MRMSGALFSRAELDTPWAISSGQLSVGVFHAVVEGDCHAVVTGHDPIALSKGDVVYLPTGADHVMCDEPSRMPTPRNTMRTELGSDGMEVLEVAGKGPHTTLLCGTVEIQDSEIHPLVALLPPVVHVAGDDDLAGRVPTIIELLAAEVRSGAVGSDAASSRLTDVLVIQVLRRYVEQANPNEAGWLRALHDPALAEALGLIHREPDRAWTASALASEVGMSRSSFFARFRELVGEPPTEYLTRWRMHLAGQRLRDGESVANTARAVGYSTEASFSNAFLRLTGVRPSEYRANAA
jgi:AraC-like DNA-binding protein